MTEYFQTVQNQSGHDQLVWYAGYGSNTDLTRFMCYIAGGTPLGTNRVYLGCADNAPPIAHTALKLPFQLYFAGDSLVWTGGVAFIGHKIAESNSPTLASAYLIKLSQFEQLVAQENGRDEIFKVDLRKLQDRGHITLGEGSGRYDEIMFGGMYKNYPIVSITSPIVHLTYNRPAQAYLQTMATGLTGDLHGLTTAEIVDYLLQKPGISGSYTALQLHQFFA
jgi:hypothetical protein